jgi:hypothetical protein
MQAGAVRTAESLEDKNAIGGGSLKVLLGT